MKHEDTDQVHCGPGPFSLSGPDLAVALPTSPGYYFDGGQTHYYEILSQNLPLLDPVRTLPLVGKPLADLVQPDLRVIVDLGYGNGYADIPTPAEFFPSLDLPTVLGQLLNGAQQGVTAALVDVGLLPVADLPTLYPYLPSVDIPGMAAPSAALPGGLADAGPDPGQVLSDLGAGVTALGSALDPGSLLGGFGF